MESEVLKESVFVIIASMAWDKSTPILGHSNILYKSRHLDQGWETMAIGPNLDHHLLLQISFYWNMIILVHLHTVYCCFQAMRAELTSCNRNCMAHKT